MEVWPPKTVIFAQKCPGDVITEINLGGPVLGPPKIGHFQKFITSSKNIIFWCGFFLLAPYDVGASSKIIKNGVIFSVKFPFKVVIFFVLCVYAILSSYDVTSGLLRETKMIKWLQTTERQTTTTFIYFCWAKVKILGVEIW